MPTASSAYGRNFANKGLTSAQSLLMVQSALESLKNAPDPELEKKDEFAASSLWQVAAKANQEDYKQIFKDKID